MNFDLVSVIIPTYNMSKYLPEAIDSVLAQTYLNLEIIVVNDGSTDNIKEATAGYTDRIIYIEQENEGPASSRNTGIAHASGNYIAFLDADDLWLPKKIEKQMKIFQDMPDTALVYSRMISFDNNSNSDMYVFPKRIYSGLIFDRLLVENLMLLSSVIIKTNILKEVGLFDKGLLTAEDTNLWLRIARQHEITGLEDVLVRRRKHGSNISDQIDIPVGTLSNLDRIVEMFPETSPVDYPPMKSAYMIRGKSLLLDYINHGKFVACHDTCSRLLEIEQYNPQILAYYFLSSLPQSFLALTQKTVRHIRKKRAFENIDINKIPDKLISILFIISNLDRGGYEMRLLDLVKNCPKHIKIMVCVTTEHQSLLNEFKAYNTEIIFMPIKKAYIQFAKIMKLYAYTTENDVKIISTYDLKGTIIALIIKLMTLGRIKIVHNTVDLLHGYKLRHKILLRYVLKFVDKVLCNSISSTEILVQGFINKNKIQLINNGVDVDKFKKINAANNRLLIKCKIDKDDIVIGTVANFRHEKNYPFLVDAFEKIISTNKNIKLVCVGGGPLLETTKTMVMDRKLNDFIIFTGYVQNVHEYLNIMDIFVLCSKMEGFPNSLIQAMSMELPVVAANVGGCTEIVDNDTDGYLYTSENTDEFIEKVMKLIDDREASKKIGLNAKNKIHERYTLPVMIDKYMRFFSELGSS